MQWVGHTEHHPFKTIPNKVCSLRNTIAMDSYSATKNKYGAATPPDWMHGWEREFRRRVCVLGAHKSESGFRWKGQYSPHTDRCAGWGGASVKKKQRHANLTGRWKPGEQGQDCQRKLSHPHKQYLSIDFQMNRLYGQEQWFKTIRLTSCTHEDQRVSSSYLN